MNQTALQNGWQHHFPEPWGGGEALWAKLAHRGSGNGHTFCLLNEKDRFFATFCDPLSDFFTHNKKGHKGWLLKK
jgi:hypothetical protein